MYNSKIINNCEELIGKNLSKCSIVDTNTNRTFIHKKNSNFILEIKDNNIIATEFMFCNCSQELLYLYIETNRLLVTKQNEEKADRVTHYKYGPKNFLLNKKEIHMNGKIVQVIKCYNEFYYLVNNVAECGKFGGWYVTPEHPYIAPVGKVNIDIVFDAKMYVSNELLYVASLIKKNDYYESCISLYSLDPTSKNKNYYIMDIKMSLPTNIFSIKNNKLLIVSESNTICIKNKDEINTKNSYKFFENCLVEEKYNCFKFYNKKNNNVDILLKNTSKPGIKLIRKMCDVKLIFESIN
ncbi:hypothetical protein Catovirus_1_681 [Catovirus CTV1]|uniref:Uncharacterized protein n=1 Tax=Catovirus CTV1 TaxID=1977631 RepID=A0A1V0SAB8_9VIRU|nr:hypothetical protein Catovirus_1_681 [Catovirus CTV1]